MPEPGARRRRSLLALPSAWLALTIALPLLLVLTISVSTPTDTVPPYAPLLRWSAAGTPSLAVHLDAYGYLIHDRIYAVAVLSSLATALQTTVLCLLVGTPMALAIARAAPRLRGALIVLVVLPFWTSSLIRTYAWIGLLKQDGPLDALLLDLHLVAHPLALLYTQGAVAIGMTYAYLPFMVLPLVAVLERQDSALVEAATDLGATPVGAFLAVTLPLSVPGIVAGGLLVFIPAVGEYVVPALLGGPSTLMIATQLWTEFFANEDWPTASAVTVVLLVLLVVPLLAFERVRARLWSAR